ncbi:HEPN domain-containing protein [Chryseobacterium camelliae]|uniref:HEPN domain-containing protein n=1 Tax=Chryseobacterium camelliae TaxID=1265445 RepID=A0ABY7QLI6_9FLAO|nr:HEPN domain-containing protein [Chryseobacterium camelliae]WBV59901.1 HEPN domain-containing protein [Chryseobacterium camelliae]
MSNIYYKRAICFCNKKIKKGFNCDWFQIIPLEDYIDSDINTTHYPFILEYQVNKDNISYFSYEDVLETIDDKTKKFLSESDYEYRTMIYILKLLSVVSNFHFFVYNVNDQGWFLNLNGASSEEFSCKYGAKVYYDESLKDKMIIKEFSTLSGDEIEPIEHSKYYTNPDLDNERNNEVTFSQYTKLFFQFIEKLDTLQKQYFDSAVTLIYNGQNIRNSMKSLAFLAFISSIEAMTNLEGKVNKEEIEFECKSCQSIKSSSYHCKSCGKPIWGISQQIKLYLEKYLSADERFKTIINKLYSRRSKIAHTGSLLTGDQYFEWDNPKTREEHNNELIAAMQYSKMSIVNYVLKNGKKKKLSEQV